MSGIGLCLNVQPSEKDPKPKPATNLQIQLDQLLATPNWSISPAIAAGLRQAFGTGSRWCQPVMRPCCFSINRWSISLSGKYTDI
ncbi:Hypothetical predicted protein [Olea europaea subsp. europaea]|uniref:Uncharacterized protein n=1 Tax=Olea europaea subsp. europaea TaxID=158383 RepID=A0A8S0S3L1_OLEEU|nr:Hypothetical predicted protein [Olea europaea subsp. europaea]